MTTTWNSNNAAHLLRRAGFGATAADVKKALKNGLAGTVKSLFKPDKSSDKYPTKPNPESLADLQLWWLKRMLSTSSPLVEKLTLFWHNHFATAYSKVGDLYMMHLQNRTLRKLGMGSFRDLMTAVAKDPAMIVWLDNDSNHKDAPNENFARELQELFTTGVYDKDGNANYTEQDVIEAARAFTGWTTWDYEFHFADWDHDYGSKTFKGETGDLDGTDVIDMLVVEDATARRLAMKLFSYFAYEVELADPVLDPLVDAYQANDTEIRPVLEVLFKSDVFYSEEAKRARVKSPVEFFVGTLHMLGAKITAVDWVQYTISDMLAEMGQAPFDPPSVFGWAEGLPWVSSNGLLQRLRVAKSIADARKADDSAFSWKTAKFLGKKTKWKNLDAAEVVAAHLAALDAAHASETTVAALAEYLAADEDGNPAEFALDAEVIDTKVRGLVALIQSSPEYQLA